jgi:hypothetical protein
VITLSTIYYNSTPSKTEIIFFPKKHVIQIWIIILVAVGCATFYIMIRPPFTFLDKALERVSPIFFIDMAQMNHTIKSVALALSLVLSNGSIAYAQNSERALEAAQRGDYAKAFREWRPLAEQVNSP